MSLKKANFLHGCKKKMWTQLLIFFYFKKPPPDVPLRGFAKLSTLKEFFGKLLPLVKFHEGFFSGFVYLFFEAPKEHWAFIPRIVQRKLWGLDFRTLCQKSYFCPKIEL